MPRLSNPSPVCALSDLLHALCNMYSATSHKDIFYSPYHLAASQSDTGVVTPHCQLCNPTRVLPIWQAEVAVVAGSGSGRRANMPLMAMTIGNLLELSLGI